MASRSIITSGRPHRPALNNGRSPANRFVEGINGEVHVSKDTIAELWSSNRGPAFEDAGNDGHKADGNQSIIHIIQRPRHSRCSFRRTTVNEVRSQLSCEMNWEET
ncbi:hypothetical protein [Rhodoblastus sp.]|uniref:hypothetical protein n=1 Tax=Rhodoblastus sp. TaxID=1962975 RepID=UPI003F9654A4